MTRLSARTLAVVVLVAAALGATLVAVSAIGSRESSRSASVVGAGETQRLLAGIPQRGNTLGRPSATVTLVEYADFQCPYCASFTRETFPTLVRDYVRTGRAKVVFRGIAMVGPDSLPPLQAAFAGARQDRLWNVTHLVYANQGAENSGWVTERLLRSIGEAVPGLNASAMIEDRSSAAVETAVGDAQEGAVTDGVRSTPTFILVGETGSRTIEGALPTSVFRQALDQLLEA